MRESRGQQNRRGGRWRRWSGALTVAGAAALTAALVTLTLATVDHSADAAPSPAPAPQERVYYIAADHVAWNYAPDGKNDITGRPFDDVAGVFTAPGPDRIGTTYTKSLYREYTDASFHTLKPRPAAWAHLGFLGPVIHAEVGDKVRLVFKNNLQRPVSIHMHGLKYDKGAEGAPYADGTGVGQQGDDAVPPGSVYTYD